MAFLRLQENTPTIYNNDSRDFQLFCRLYDCVNNAVMSDIGTMTNILVSNDCNSGVLDLLATKLGFYPKHELTNEELRYVLGAFPHIMRYKGSKRAIEEAINVYLKINRINSGVYVEVINKDAEGQKYIVKVGIESKFRDVTILDELFRYILPTGYTVEYFFYEKFSDVDEYIDKSRAFVVIAPDWVTAGVKNDLYTNPL